MTPAPHQTVPPNRRRSWLPPGLFVIALSLTNVANLADEPRESPTPPDVSAAANGGAAVVRDDDLERLLFEADRLLERREWDLAVALLQRVLDECRDVVMVVEHDGALTPLASAAERRLAQLPPDGLRRYRLRVDGDARARLANGSDSEREDRLADVARRFFFSAQGDDATWELAGRALDAHDFVAASAFLDRLASLHPDPTANRSAIWLRKSLAAAYLGDSESAEVALRESERHAPEPQDVANQHVVREHIRKLLVDPQQARKLTASPSAPPTVDGQALDRQTLDRQTRAASGAAWQAGAAIVAPRPSDSNQRPGTPMAAESAQDEGRESGRAAAVLRLTNADSFGSGYDDILVRTDAASSGRRWLEAGWAVRPSITLDGGRTYATLDRRLCAVTRLAGEWRRDWTAAPGSPFSLPAAWTMLAAQDVSLRDPPRKLFAEDARCWADGMRHAVTACDEVVLSVESLPVVTSDLSFLSRRRWSWRARANELVAYASTTGNVLWRKRPSQLLQVGHTARDLAGADPQDASLLGPAARGDGRCFVPLLVGSTLHIAAMDPHTGAVAWSSRVAGEPRDGAWPWSCVAVTCAGRDVYVAAGIGLIAAFDQRTGAVRWITRYPRSRASRSAGFADTTTAKGQLPSSGAVPATVPSGWDEDRVVPIGRQLVVVASDDDALTTYDRRTGAPLWSTPRRPPGGTAATQLVGVNADHIVVSGADVVRCYDLRTGKLRWQHSPGILTGAAALLESCVVVPCLTSSQSNAARPLGTSDPLRGQAARVELEVLDIETGKRLHRRPVVVAAPLPLSVISTVHGLTLVGQDRMVALAPSHDAPPSPPDALAPLVREARDRSASAAPITPSAINSESKRSQDNRLILSDLARGRVSELEDSGKVLWTFEGLRFPGPCCGWNDGRRWVLDHERNEIVELDGTGRPMAVLSGLPGRPSRFHAEADGSALLAFPDSGLVGQVRANGSWQWHVRVIGRPVDAVRRAGGSTWVALWEDRRVVELNEAGTIVGAIAFDSRPRDLQPAADGALYVTLADLGQVFQVRRPLGSDRFSPQLVRSGGTGLRSALRLRDGRWLVAEQTGIALWGGDGKLLWKREGDVVGGLAVVEP